MRTAKRTGIAALFAVFFALLLAGCLCLGLPAKREAQAAEGAVSEEEITYKDETLDGISTPAELMDAYKKVVAGQATEITLAGDIRLDMMNDETITGGFPKNGHLGLPKSVTFDLNGKTLNIITGGDFCINIGQTVEGTDKTNATVTIKNGKLIGQSSDDFAIVQEGSTLNLEKVDVQFTAPEDTTSSIRSAAVAVNDGATLNVNNVMFSKLENAVPVFVGDPPSSQGTVNFTSVDPLINLRDQINASSEYHKVETKLTGNIDGSLVVPEYANITIDLNGYTITNTADKDTITNYGTLTIEDGSENDVGKVTNAGGSKAAIRNYGTASLCGGTYTRTVAEGATTSYYVIKNVGYMMIGSSTESGVKVTASDEYSSLIANGYYGDADKKAHVDKITVDNACTMIIYDGTFTGGMNVVKNDNEGVLTIHDGTFTNSYREGGYSGSVITAAGKSVTIYGGTFKQEETSAHGLRIAASGKVTTTVVVAGGTFTEGTDVYLMNGGVDEEGKEIPTGTLDVTIQNGVFNGTLKTENFNGKVLDTDKIKITGGTFNADLALGSTMQVAISGGDYKSIPKSDYLDENVKMYQYTEDAGEKNDYFVIVGATEEKPANTEETGYIRVGKVGYANTLADAFKMAAEQGATSIYLCADITESVTYTGGYMTIYLDGYTWTADGAQPALTNETTSSSGLRIRSSTGVDGGAIVRTTAGPVIVNKTTLAFYSSSSGKYTVKNESSGDYALIENHGKLTVTSGTFESAGTFFKNVEGGTISVNVSVNGGTFNQEVDAEFIASGYACVNNGDGTYGIMEVVAQIVRDEEMISYTDWATAKSALQSGDTLVLLASVEGGLTINSGMTVSLELRAGKLNGAIINYGNLTILGEGTGTVTDTITNGESAELTITGGTFENDLIADGQDITITGGTFKGGRTTSAGTGSTYIKHIAPYVDNESGYYLIDHTQGYTNKYTVGEGTPVVLIEDGNFSMYVGSVDAAQGYILMGAGEDVTVTLCANIESFTFSKKYQSEAKNVTFDLNGKSIAGGIIIEDGLAVTIIGNGTVEGTVTVESGTLSIQGGTFTVKPDESYLAAGMTVYEVDGKYLVGDQSAVAFVMETSKGYTSLQDAIDAAGEGATVTLLKDAAESVTIAEGKNITLDLNGQTLKNKEGSHTITNYGTLTITDSSGNGTVKATETKAMAVLNYGTALLASGTFTRSAETSGYVIKNYGYMTIGEDEKSSVIVSSENTDSSLVVSGYFDDADKEANNEGKITVTENKLTLVINGGTFTGGKIAIKNDDLGVMTIKNGTFKNNTEAVVQNSYQMTIENGTFTQENKSGRAIVATSEQYANVASTKITGGEFKSAGYVLANGVGNYPATETMEISGGSFTTTSTSASVVYVAKDGNLTVTGGSFVGESAKYGINFSGSKLSVSGENTSIKAKDGIYVSRAGAEVELSDVKVEATGNSLRFVRPKSVTISSGEYTGNVVITPDSDTTANITGGDFNGALEVNTVNAELTGFIEGGAFSEMPKMDYFAEDCIAEYNEVTGKYETKAGSWVAANGEEGYASLQDAINAAENGDTVKLLADVTLTEALTIDKSVTIDLNDKTLTSTNSTSNNFNIEGGTAEDVKISVKIMNGSIVGAFTALNVKNYVELTLEGVELTTALNYGIQLRGDGEQTVNLINSTVTGAAAGVVLFTHIAPTELTVSLYAENSTITGTDGFGISGNGNPGKATTDIQLVNSTVTSNTGTAIYHPQDGTLVVDGGKVTGLNAGIEMRSGSLTVKGGAEITATATEFSIKENGNGTTITGAAIGVSQHSTNLAINVDLQDGTYNGVYAFYEEDIQDPETGAEVALSIKGGAYNGKVESKTVTGFIEGGDFGVKPADKLMNENYAAEYVNGRYVAVPSTALKEARLAAQADVRAYAATMGFVWSDIVAAEAKDESAVEAQLVLTTYNAIAEAMSTLAVAEAKDEAFDAVDDYAAAMDDYAAAIGEAFAELVADAIEAIKTAAAASENQTAVVVPTATYAAIYAAETEAELEYLKDNAIAEIEDIRAYRGEIAAQAEELETLAAAFAAIDDGLFGTEDAQGAIKDIQDAIAAAQEAITNGDGTTSTSLKQIYDYLNGTLKSAVDDISNMLNGAVSEGGILYEMQETLEALDATVNGALLEKLNTAITNAQEAINGNTATEMGEAVKKITDAIAAAQEVIIAELPDYEETLGEIAGSVDKLEELLGGTNGLVAIKKGIDGALAAIGTADGETLFGQLAAIESGNTAIKTTVDELAAALTGTDGAIATLTAALTAMQGDITELTGALAEDTGWVAKDIAAAQAEIDKLTAAVGKLGTVDGKDLAAVVGEIADGLEEMDATVNSIASTVSAASAVEEAKTQAAADIRTWLEGYLEELAGDTAQADVLARAAYTAETTEGELYKDISAQFGEENGKLVLKYYNEALAAIDAATTVSDVTTAVATFRAQVASIEASAGNSTDLTVVYVLLGVVLLVLIIACIVALVKGGRKPEPAPAQAAPAEKPAETQPEEKAEEKEEQAEEAAPAEEPAGEMAPAEEESAAAEDDDKERVVISANVRTFDEAYEDLTDEQRELFNKVKEYALAKEDAVEVKQSGGVVIKRKSKQIVKLTVRRDMPVALFLLENEMLKDFRRNAKSEAKLKVRATELVIREADDLETAYTMVDLSVEQIEKDLEAAKERRREARRQRRLQRQAEEAAAEQAEGAGEPAPAEEPASAESAATDGTDTE